ARGGALPQRQPLRRRGAGLGRTPWAHQPAQPQGRHHRVRGGGGPHDRLRPMTMGLRERVKLFLKGMAMGAADTVPGVSGGTIAFVSGIYEELLRSIRSIGPDTLSTLRRQGLAAAWRQVNGGFLLTLVAGIVTSVLLLVRPITWALDHHPVLIWSFF